MNIFSQFFIRFLVKFLIIFSILYYGSFAIIGISAPGGYYSHFISEYLNYISGLQHLLIWGSKHLLSIFNIETLIGNHYVLRVVGGRGVIVSYGCAGFGVMSFWAAFILAGISRVPSKLFWIFFGFLIIWIINVIRISLFLLSVDRGWPMPLGIDHHTWFNIGAYGAIFILIYFHERSTSSLEAKNRKSV